MTSFILFQSRAKKNFRRLTSLVLSFAMIFTAFGPGIFAVQDAIAQEVEEGAKIAICHLTESESNPWSAVWVSVNANVHEDHHLDFPYSGPVKGSGQPDNKDKQADQWCEDNAPEPEPATGTITVIKTVEGSNVSADSFSLFVGDEPVVNGEEEDFDLGSYVVSETPVDDFIPTFEGDCDENGNINLTEDDPDQTCTITNTYSPDDPQEVPVINLDKTVEYNPEKQRAAYTITWSVSGGGIDDLVITDTLPAWSDGVVGSISKPTTPPLSPGDLNYDVNDPTANRTIIWELGSQEDGASGEITFKVELLSEETCRIDGNTVEAEASYGDGQTVSVSATSDPISIESENCDPVSEEPICEPGEELVLNGSFEDPIVGDPAKWDVFTSVLGWDFDWMDGSNQIVPTLELHRGVLGLAAHLDQYVELDGDWYGPSDPTSGEPASTALWQDIPTVDGKNYEVKFAFKPRPDTLSDAQNTLGILWGGNEVDVLNSADTDSNDWTTFTYEVVADSTLSRLQFEDRGTSDSLGTFIDSVSVMCLPDEPDEPTEEDFDVYVYKYVNGELVTGTDAEFIVDVNIGDGGTNLNLSSTAPSGVVGDVPNMSFVAVEEVVGDDQDTLPLGSQCEVGQYRLLGYSYGSTVGGAETATLSATANLDLGQIVSGDQHVIVWNEECLPPPCVEGPTWADGVDSSSQGKRKDGSNVLAGRTNPDNTLGTPDGNGNAGTGFFALGVGGTITVRFDHYVENVEGDDLSFHEITNERDSYPEENASVEVSQDGETWQSIGTVSSKAVDGVDYLDFDPTGWSWIQYVRITDTTNFGIHADNSDGYDLDAVDATNGLCEEPEEDIITTNGGDPEPDPDPEDNGGGGGGGGGSSNRGGGGSSSGDGSDNDGGEILGAFTDLPGLPNTGNGSSSQIPMIALSLILALVALNVVGLRVARKS